VRPETYVYDSRRADDTVERVRERLAARDDVTLIDAAADGGARDATIALKQAVRIGSPPDALYDDGGLDFGPGALVTVEPTGRKGLHVGADALSALDEWEE
jgi:hypothetical protein